MKRLLLSSLCLLSIAAAARAQSDAQKKQTIAYLQKLQTDDGGFRADSRAERSDLSSLEAAIRALTKFGGAARDKAACIAFVEKCFDKDGGGFAARPGGKAAYLPTAIGVMAVVELKMPMEPYLDAVIKYLDEHSKTFEEIRLTAASFEALGKRPPHAEAWLKQIAKLRHEDGTYGEADGKARDTGSAVCAVLRLGGEAAHTDNVLRALNAGQRKDGGFGKQGTATSDLSSSYRIMRAFHMLKAKPKRADDLRTFIARCRNEDGGYGVEPGHASNVSGTYYAAMILHWLDEK